MIIEERGMTKEGYEYIVAVHISLGHRLGYVGVFPTSPLYKIKFDGTDDEGEEINGYEGLDHHVHVHGGLTYSGQLQENIIGAMNPHYFGFDCAHLDDAKMTPAEMNLLYESNLPDKSEAEIAGMMKQYSIVFSLMGDIEDGIPRDLDYVRSECFHLSSQLKDLEADYVVV